MDEGWTRYVFDDLGVPYITLRNADFKAAKKEKLDLRSKYDVIVFAERERRHHQDRQARSVFALGPVLHSQSPRNTRAASRRRASRP